VYVGRDKELDIVHWWCKAVEDGNRQC